ncbi:hypothetical protein C0585_04840 [Candidatus Woesearchaeota archaeon]|nr:MAG: hypothetical protein C0585_04840 [Candidatus Woesearchaeota archaeon]
MEKLRKIETADGSITYFNPKFGEAYHSITVGAMDEARVKYVEPADIKSGDKVLDFCFGLGYNSLLAIELVKDIQIVGIEKDKGILKEILDNKPPKYDESYEKIKSAVLDTLNDRENNNVNIILGDGLEEAKKLKNKYFDAILFDPFSPGKHPELWSKEVFNEMFRVMKKGAKLTTYSCATWIRNNMREAGFEVVDGPIFGRKSASTVAIKP